MGRAGRFFVWGVRTSPLLLTLPTHATQDVSFSVLLFVEGRLAQLPTLHNIMIEPIKYLNTISPLSQGVIHSLTELFKPAVLKENEFFIEEGKYAKEIGFLESGIARAFFVNNEGKEYNKQFFVGPTLIGAYTSLLTKQKNKIAQKTLTACKIWIAPFHEIELLYAKHHDFERLGRKIAEYYFLEKEKKEIEMALLDAENRYLILREEFPGLEMEIPQYHIASYLGISATQLSRVRNKMARR
jgi:CRP-like cAMP-binding protein